MAFEDPTSDSRKKDHLDLSLQSVVHKGLLDPRFHYEPLLAGHPSQEDIHTPQRFLGKAYRTPIWVSSMTGGTKEALKINENLARACAEFGMGMGLGSCRPLLEGDGRLKDFNFRHIIGEEQVFYANLGVAQIETLLNHNQGGRIVEMVGKLKADGLIVHVNPMQEFTQPEGDRFGIPPLRLIQWLKDELPGLNIIVKEVGQGMGPDSLKALMQMDIEAIEFGAAGGTNFALLELLRADQQMLDAYQPLTRIGHSAEDMVRFINNMDLNPDDIKCKQFIISGGIRNFLDGYYLSDKLQYNNVYGQASAFLKHARGDYADLKKYVQLQIEGLQIAKKYLKVV